MFIFKTVPLIETLHINKNVLQIIFYKTSLIDNCCQITSFQAKTHLSIKYAPSAGEITILAAKVALTKPYANDLSFSSVTSATYANTTLNVTANTPEILIIAKNQNVLIVINGIGKHVKKTVINRNNLRPQTSDNAPTNGALKNDRIPLMPIIRPFMRNVCDGKVVFNTAITGMVSRPHAKNSRNITTRAWYRLGMPMPDV